MPYLPGSHPLDADATFPRLALTTSDDRSIVVPEVADAFGVVIIYRGEW